MDSLALPKDAPSEAARNVVVPESLAGARLDKAVAALLPELSRARIKRAVELGAVRVNGRRMAKGGSVVVGDVVRIDVARVADVAPLITPDAPLRVLHSRTSKSSWSTNPRDSLRRRFVPARQARSSMPARSLPRARSARAGGVHRARASRAGDRPPARYRDQRSALLVARTAPAFDELRLALKEGRLEKSYLLVCSEQGLPDEGTIDFPLTNHPKDQRRVYACTHPRDVIRYDPRPASTRYRVVQRAGVWALVEASVGKALRHQLRAHFAAIGYPLAGDELYGGSVIRALGRQALHASRIAYRGGALVNPFDAQVPLPKDIKTLLESTTPSEASTPSEV
jgi:23S rRNA pseudouridine1911/1915/1917 synthase